MSDLRDQINTLSAAERLELLDALWVSLEREELPLTDAQRAELDHRIALYEQNPAEVIPWERVKANLLKKA
jgi:putative addiction module component (TIGR02574 family)